MKHAAKRTLSLLLSAGMMAGLMAGMPVQAEDVYITGTTNTTGNMNITGDTNNSYITGGNFVYVENISTGADGQPISTGGGNQSFAAGWTYEEPVRFLARESFEPGETFPDIVLPMGAKYETEVIYIEHDDEFYEPGDELPDLAPGTEVTLKIEAFLNAYYEPYQLPYVFAWDDTTENDEGLAVPMNEVTLTIGNDVIKGDALVNTYYEGQMMYIEFPITIGESAKEIIDCVIITDLDKPLPYGAALDRDAKARDGLKVVEVRYCDTDGIGLELDENNVPVEELKAGDEIQVWVMVEAGEGQVFAEEMLGYWDDDESEFFCPDRGKWMEFMFEYTVEADEAQFVSQLNFDLSGLKVGVNPSTDVEMVLSSVGAYVVDIGWDPLYSALPAGKNTYTITAAVYPAGGYAFAPIDEMEAYVNGEEAKVVESAKQDIGAVYDVIYTFEMDVPAFDLVPAGDTAVKVYSAMKEYTFETAVKNTDGKVTYRWYECDKNGKIVNKALLGSSSKLRVTGINDFALMDTHYYICLAVSGAQHDAQIFSITRMPRRMEIKNPSAKLTFADVPETEWYHSYVKAANQVGLINGKSADAYMPEMNMTYAEAIKLAVCMNIIYNGGDPSTDIANGKTVWYSTYMDYALENGIIDYDLTSVADTFITREEYVYIFSKALPEEALKAVNLIPTGAIPDVEGKTTLNEVKTTLDTAKTTLDLAKTTLDEIDGAMTDIKTTLDTVKTTLKTTLRTIDSQASTSRLPIKDFEVVGNYPHKTLSVQGMINVKTTLDGAKTTLTTAKTTLDTAKTTLDTIETGMINVKTTLDNGMTGVKTTLDGAKTTLTTAKTTLDTAKTTLDEALKLMDALTSELLAKDADAEDIAETIDAAVKMIESAEAKLERGKTTLKTGKTTLDGAKTTLDGAKTTLDGAKTTLGGAKTTLNTAKTTLDGAKTTLDGAKTTLDGAKTTLGGAKTTLDDAKTTLTGAKTTLETALAELEKLDPNANYPHDTFYVNYKTTLEGAKTTLDVMENGIKEWKTTLDGAKTTLDVMENGIKEWKTTLDGAKTTLDAANGIKEWAPIPDDVMTGAKTTLDTAKTTLDGAKTTLGGAKTTLDIGKTTLDTAKTTLDGAKTTLETAKTTLDDGKTTLDGAKTTLRTAIAAIETAKTTLDVMETGMGFAKTTLDEIDNALTGAKTTLDGAKTTLGTLKTTLDGDQNASRSDAIYAFYRAGILNGTDAQGTFNRTGTIKRSEVAAIIIRMMDPSFRVGAPADLAMVNK